MSLIKVALRVNSLVKPEVVVFEDVDLNDKISVLKDKVSTQSKYGDEVELVYCGKLLKDCESLNDAGCSTGSLLQCLPKWKDQTPVATPLTLLEIPKFAVALKTMLNHSGFRTFSQKLKEPELVEKIMKACPFLKHDPSALPFIQDPDLFLTLCVLNTEKLTKLVEEHPAIARLAGYLATLISSETSSRSHHVSYSIDALSDEDEDMDAEQSGDSTAGSRASGSMAYQPITPGQLAAALANATGGGPSSRSSRSNPTTPSAGATPFNTPGPPSASASTGPLASPGNVITTEMFSQALQNAFAASATSGGAESSSSIIPSSASTSTIENLGESLQLMREMGITDQEMCINALQATNGDVGSAVNMIFARLLSDNEYGETM